MKWPISEARWIGPASAPSVPFHPFLPPENQICALRRSYFSAAHIFRKTRPNRITFPLLPNMHLLNTTLSPCIHIVHHLGLFSPIPRIIITIRQLLFQLLEVILFPKTDPPKHLCKVIKLHIRLFTHTTFSLQNSKNV